MANDLIVIGISGPARSGKDSAAQSLVLSRGFHRVALADGIREAFNSLSGPTGEFFKELVPDHNYRRSLQLMGTESREAIDRALGACGESPDRSCRGHWIWLALIKVHYAAFIHPVPRRRFVVPDIRHDFEAEALRAVVRSLGGRFSCLKLHRPGVGPIAEAGHSSEQGIAGVRHDHLITNDGTLEALAAGAVAFADAVLKGEYCR